MIDTGVSPEEVAADYDLDLADVYRALTYYYDHPDEMQEMRKQWQTIPENMRVLRSPDDLDCRDGVEKEA